ncbi:hypothetical protein LTR41_007959 [Exophiala xenobiotica]|nr:hypothetical protein LTR41_007959 [Exophiala xenobiotica]
MHKYRREAKYAAWYDDPDDTSNFRIRNPFAKWRPSRQDDMHTMENGEAQDDGQRSQRIAEGNSSRTSPSTSFEPYGQSSLALMDSGSERSVVNKPLVMERRTNERRTNARTSVRTQLSLKLQGQSHTALADTGAQENVMSAALAKELHLELQTDRGTTHSFENAVGKRMEVAGHATVDCRFSDEPHNPVSMKFWILEKVVVPLIVGRRFLEETSCLTRFRHRLQRINVFRNLSPRILHMELPRVRLQCQVGDQLLPANPDTGSDLDLMSASYFQQSNFRLQELEHSLHSVEFADGSTARLSGFVRVPFAMGSGGQPTHLRDFYVLEGLTTDILLGNGTLEDFDAFHAYKNDFFDLDEFDVRCDLHYIRWVSRSGNADFLESPFKDFKFMVPNRVSESEARYEKYLQYQDDKETRRRSKTKADIAKRPPSQRQPALDSEQQLRRSYDQRRDAFIARHRAAVAAATGTSGP